MGAYKQPRKRGRATGQTKYQLRAPAAWMDFVARVAAERGYKGVAAYMREATQDQMRRHGYEPPSPDVKE